MLIINNKYKFLGTIDDIFSNYGITPKCFGKLNIEKVPECYEFLYTGLQEIETIPT